jgi:sugar O-acyltransferase (sialic acid O-acetyltransferase NeuD family)
MLGEDLILNSVVGKKLTILGAGGHGRVVADIAESLGYAEIRFADNRWPAAMQNLHWPIIAKSLDADLDCDSVFVGIGHNDLRLSLLQHAVTLNRHIATLVHGSAVVSQYAQLGLGSVVMPQAAINVGTRVGMGCIVNTGATVDHDCDIGDGVHVSPGAHLAGGVTVGEASWIGIGASVKEGCRIGAHAMVAAGAVVVENVAEGARVFGVPARAKHN